MSNNVIDHSHRPIGHSIRSNGNGRQPDIVAHLATALARHVRELRLGGAPVPTEIEELAAIFVQHVRSRLDQTIVDKSLWPTHAAAVAERLLVTKQEAAERLGVSERTIDRLVAAGRLPLVHVERAARLRVSDLESFVNELPKKPGPRPDAGSSP